MSRQLHIRISAKHSLTYRLSRGVTITNFMVMIDKCS